MTDSTSTSDPVPVAAVVLGPGEGRRVPQTSVVIKAERRHSGGTLTIYEATIAPRRAGPNPTSIGVRTRRSTFSRER